MRTWTLVGICIAAAFAATSLSATAAAPPLAAAAGLNFVTPTVVAAPGETIAFRNLEPVLIPHTLDADDGSFSAGEVGPLGTSSFTAPATPGTYGFTCAVHPLWMKGVLVVQ